MIRLLFIVSFVFSFSNASVTLQSIYFNDYEQNASNYFLAYYPRQDFIDLGLSSSVVDYVIYCRDIGSPTLECFSMYGAAPSDLRRIREKSHLIDWNVYTDDFGMTLTQTNFLYALSGVLFGFTWLFIASLIAARKF